MVIVLESSPMLAVIMLMSSIKCELLGPFVRFPLACLWLDLNSSWLT